jgi:hypothetical protein
MFNADEVSSVVDLAKFKVLKHRPVALQKDFLKCAAMRLHTAQLPGVHPSLRDSSMLK